MCVWVYVCMYVHTYGVSGVRVTYHVFSLQSSVFSRHLCTHLARCSLVSVSGTLSSHVVLPFGFCCTPWIHICTSDSGVRRVESGEWPVVSLQSHLRYDTYEVVGRYIQYSMYIGLGSRGCQGPPDVDG